MNEASIALKNAGSYSWYLKGNQQVPTPSPTRFTHSTISGNGSNYFIREPRGLKLVRIPLSNPLLADSRFLSNLKDPHWMDKEFCKAQENDRLHSDNGCFLLSHDRPVSLRRNYNTTSNLLDLLGQEWIQPFVTGESKIHVALCFKTRGFSPCDGSQKAQQWTSLVDSLFDSYTEFVEETGIQVEFVLDGAGTAGGGRDCLQEYWRPWNYTWIIHDDPDAAFISNSPTSALDRFQIMNTPVPDSIQASRWTVGWKHRVIAHSLS